MFIYISPLFIMPRGSSVLLVQRSRKPDANQFSWLLSISLSVTLLLYLTFLPLLRLTRKADSWPVLLLLSMPGIREQKAGIQIFIMHQFAQQYQSTVVKRMKQLQCPSMKEFVHKQCTCTTLNFKDILLSKISQVQNGNYYKNALTKFSVSRLCVYSRSPITIGRFSTCQQPGLLSIILFQKYKKERISYMY